MALPQPLKSADDSIGEASAADPENRMTPNYRFRALTKGLLRVKPEELRDAERIWREGRKRSSELNDPVTETLD